MRIKRRSYGYHEHQAFMPGEVMAEEAHSIGHATSVNITLFDTKWATSSLTQCWIINVPSRSVITLSKLGLSRSILRVCNVFVPATEEPTVGFDESDKHISKLVERDSRMDFSDSVNLNQAAMRD